MVPPRCRALPAAGEGIHWLARTANPGQAVSWRTAPARLLEQPQLEAG